MNELVASTGGIISVSQVAADAYDSRKGILAERVNQALLARNDLASLIGGNDSIELMFENHRNHVLFMTAVFHLNAFRLLASGIPWVYKTYSQHGFSFAYFPVALAAWKQAIAQELPAEIAAEIIPVYDWVIARHEKMVALVSQISGKSSDMDNKARIFLDNLLHMDLSAAIEQGERNIRARKDLSLFYRDTVQPAMYEVGARWASGEISVAEEHMASALAQTVVAHMQVKTPAAMARRGKALITAATNEQHELGARMTAHVFESDGWEITFLGANMPLADLTHMARKLLPRFIGISIAMPYHLHHARRIIDALKNDSELNQIKILAGGLVFANFPEAADYLPGAEVVSDLEAAVLVARKWADE